MTTIPLDKKKILAGVFDRAATGYGSLAYFPIFGRRLVELAQIPRGAMVLDVASGRGALLFPAARQVGPEGQVVGVDLSERMVQETGAEVSRRGLANVRLRQMDAESLDLPDSTFDHVLCGFALAFFPDLQRALSEFRRVLKPGGRLGATTWGPSDERWRWYDELVAAYGASVKLRSQPLDTPAELREALAGAGFGGIRILTEAVDLPFADEEEWWSAEWSISGRAGLERLDPAALERFKAEAFTQIQRLKQPDGFHFRYEAQLALAANSP